MNMSSENSLGFDPRDSKEKLLEILTQRGFRKTVAEEQVSVLIEIIYLAALKRLAEEKSLDISGVNGQDFATKKAFLESNISSNELLQALTVESEIQITNYFNSMGKE